MKINLVDKIAAGLLLSRLKKKQKEIKKMAEKEGKPWYLSKGVIGGLITMAIGVAGAFGLDGLDVEKDNIIELAMSIATAAAGAVAIWGRVTAKAKLTK